MLNATSTSTAAYAAHTKYEMYETDSTIRIERFRNPPPAMTRGYIQSHAAAPHRTGAPSSAMVKRQSLVAEFALGGSFGTNGLLTRLKPSSVTTSISACRTSSVGFAAAGRPQSTGVGSITSSVKHVTARENRA